MVLLWCKRNGLKHVEVSALDGVGVNEAVETMVELAFIIMLNRRTTMHQNAQKVGEMYPIHKWARKDGKPCLGTPPIHIIDIAAFFMHFQHFLFLIFRTGMLMVTSYCPHFIKHNLKGFKFL